MDTVSPFELRVPQSALDDLQARLARVRQQLDGVAADRLHPYLREGDVVRIEVLEAGGASVFGAIEQPIGRYPAPAR